MENDESQEKSGGFPASKLLKWIDSTGYPVELRLARDLVRKEFKVAQSAYYRDSQENKYREIDVLGWLESYLGTEERPFVVRVVGCFECKQSKGKPWVVFSAPVEYEVDDGLQMVLLPLAPLFHQAFRTVLAGESDLFSNPLLKMDALTGYAAAQFTSEQKSNEEPWGAAHAVAKAAIFECQKVAQENPPWHVQMVFPCVLIEGDLFQSWVDEEGKVQCEPVNRCQLVLRNPELSGKGIVVNIATADGLDQLAADMRDVFENLVRKFDYPGHRLTKVFPVQGQN